MRHRRATLAAAAACLLPLLAACGNGATQSHAGDVVPARKDKQFAHAKLSTVMTPIGTLDVHTGKAVDHVDASDTRELAAQQAPAGMTYLPITWRLDEDDAKPYLRFVETSALPVIDLRSGDASYRLQPPDPAEGSDSFYVLIAKSDAHPALTVGFDGVTQRVDLLTGRRHAGRARGLYHLSSRPVRPRKCPGTSHFSEIADVAQTCKLTGPILLPYAAGKWAPPRRPWLAVAVTTSLAHYLQAGSVPLSAGAYMPAGVATHYRLGKKRPVDTIGVDDVSAQCPYGPTGTCNSDAALIFDSRGSARMLTVDQIYRMNLAKGYNGYEGKDREKVKETLSIPLPRAR